MKQLSVPKIFEVKKAWSQNVRNKDRESREAALQAELITSFGSKISQISPHVNLSSEKNFHQLLRENTISCGSVWKSKICGGELNSTLIADLFQAGKPKSPDFYVACLGDLRYLVYTTILEEENEVRRRRNASHALVSFSIILVTKDKTKNLDKLKDGIMHFGKMLKLIQQTTNLLRDEFYTAYEKNNEFLNSKWNPDEKFEDAVSNHCY